MADKMFDSLIELDALDLEDEPLTEDMLIETMTPQEVHDKFYPDISMDEFNKVIAIDPTYKADEEKLGNYAKWLLTLYKKGQDLTDTKEIKDQLMIFNKTKNRLPGDKRDINRYKSFPELMNYLAQNDIENKSDYQLKSQSVKGAEFVAGANGWEVYHPTTYEASRFLRGDNAVWCTGRHDDPSFFNSYNRDGDLYIFINQKNPDEKYQGYYRKGENDVREFRDARNSNEGDSKALMIQIILKSGLMNALKKSVLKDKNEIKEAEKYSDLAAGKPYVYSKDSKITRMEQFVISRVIFDPSCTEIEAEAFRNCWKIESIDIPNTVKTIGSSAFRGCTGLKTIKLPEGLTNIPEMMCRDCTNLESVHIPNSVVSIGIYAFDGCEHVKITAKKHKMTVRNADLDFLKAHLTFIEE